LVINYHYYSLFVLAHTQNTNIYSFVAYACGMPYTNYCTAIEMYTNSETRWSSTC